MSCPHNNNILYYVIANKLYKCDTSTNEISEKVFQGDFAIMKFIVRKDGKIIIAYENKIIMLIEQKHRMKNCLYKQIG